MGALVFVQTADRVTLHLADGAEATGDLLIGADGVHSRIRQQMFGQGKAHFTGIMAWRGLVPMERLPPHQRRLVGANWMGVGGHVVTYPLRRGEILNFVGVVERDDWRLESWNEPGSREECLRDLDNWHDDVKTIIRNIDTHYKWALLGAGTAGSLRSGASLRDGPTRHIPPLPFLAQGANMALEDAGGDRPGAWICRTCPMHCAVTKTLALQRTAAIVRGSSDNTKRFPQPGAWAAPEGARRIRGAGVPAGGRSSSATTGCTNTMR